MLDYEFLYIISIPIYILFIVYIIWKKVSIKKIILYTLFYFYMISLIAVTIFPIPIQGLKEIWIYANGNNNFIHLKSITDILSNDNLSYMIKMKQIIWNIVLFIPMWFFIPLIFKNINIFKKALSLWILLSFLIEITQFAISSLLGFNYKVTDIDDILLNTLGFTIGFILYKIFLIGIYKE